MYQAKTLAKKIATTIDFHKGEDIKIYDVSNKTPLARFYIVIGASNQRKVHGLASEVEEILAKSKADVGHVEGKDAESPWVLIDAHDIIINVMSNAERERLRFDSIYKDCPVVDFPIAKSN